jgi:GH15 family glucan-1,4-alpha-glucosidase
VRDAAAAPPAAIPAPSGYRPLRDYAAIGDGRTVALVARDGSIDWLCLPNLDSPSVFAACLDTERGGHFELTPQAPFSTARRYLPDTNVLETTFTTSTGVVRVIDAMTLPGARLSPFRELARRIEGVSGRVPMRWRVRPRFGYGLRATRIERRGAVPVAVSGGEAVAVCAWDAGTATVEADTIGATFEMRAGARGLIALTSAHGHPLLFPACADVEARIETTIAFWKRWAQRLTYEGAWKEAVVRSALLLKLLVFSPSGAIAAAPTTSLPEEIGGTRNWDYRFSWIRDSAFTLEALLDVGCRMEARSFFSWFMHATQRRAHVQVFYRLDGGTHAPEREIPLEGYRGSRPVRVGNGAAGQLQLDTFGDLFDTVARYVNVGGQLDGATGRDLASVAEHVCAIWREPDRGIWEVRMEPRHFTHSKAMCWVALDRAVALAELGLLPRRHLARWRREAGEIRDFVETRCWSERQQSYTRFAGSDETDASLLLMAVVRYGDPASPRMMKTIDAVRRELGRGPLLYRYLGADGLPGGEGVFLCCSFWLVEALARAGRTDEAAGYMEALLPLANDVGLYAEELDPATHDFLGNFPQGLVHFALVSAAAAITLPARTRVS